MAADSAPAEAERATKGNPPSPSRDVPADGPTAAAGAPPAGGLGERLLRTRASVGPADDPAERHADQTADRVLRMPDPTRAAPSTPPPAPAPAPGIPETPVMRAADPTPPQKVPGTPVVAPVGTGMGGDTGPETVTPTGPAPMVSAPVASGTRRAETGDAAVDAEPPAPEGEAPARETPVVPPQMQEYLDASRGKGGPLPEAVRTEFEARFQRPFDDVRVHDDTGADDAARRIDAVAFTRGNDIYFRSGSYDPSSEPGRHLLAHELAHVAQQRPGVNRKAVPGLGGAIIRRADKGAKKGKGTPGTITGKDIVIDKLPVPSFKRAALGKGPFILRKQSRKEQDTKQVSLWRSGVKSQARDIVQARIEELGKKRGASQDGPVFYLKQKGQPFYLIGTMDVVGNVIRIPVWDNKGKPRAFEVDHKHEAQLGGPDAFSNLWLLDGELNGLAGRLIQQNISRTLHNFLENPKPEPDIKKMPTEAEVRDPASKWTVEFKQVVDDPDDSHQLKATDVWDQKDFEEKDSKVLDSFEFATTKEIERLSGKPTELSIFERVAGGGVKRLPRKDDSTKVSGWKVPKVFSIDWVDFPDPATASGPRQLRGTAFSDDPKSPIKSKPFKVPLKKLAGIEWGGIATPGSIDYWVATAFSPITFAEPEFDVEKGIVGRGVITKPSLKILENVEFAVVLDGDVAIEATVQGGDLTLPGPFKVTGGTLVLRAGLNGVGVTGDVFFEIENLAKGRIGASAKAGASGGTLALGGELDFDSKMFSTARLGLSYKEGKWGVSGELVTAPKAIKGIKSGRATVEVTDGTVTAAGEFEPELKGLKKGTLGFRYNETTGMEITGEILLGEGIPGIKSGRMAATVKEGPDKHSLSGEVMIEPSIPGVTGNVTGRYDDGAFLVDASLGYEKDFAKGSIHLGVTNQAVGADGKPAGPPKPDGSLVVYGDGSVTLALTPWLKGTVGLTLKPNGEVEVRGEVALPPTFTVFDEKKIEKELLSAHVDIPIVGVSVLGQRIGIFATIGGSVSIDAGVGPGQLRDTALRVTYNPARPEDTTVSGNATFAVPAHAALRLSFHGGLGVGIPVVSATAGLNVYGEVGVAGEASASTAVIWSPSAGVVLDASASIFVEPKFKFGIDAYVDVSADLWIKTIELYHETWKLAAFEYGSNLRFGLTLPVHYESGKPFELGFDQIQWTYPHIDPKELVSGLVEQLVS